MTLIITAAPAEQYKTKNKNRFIEQSRKKGQQNNNELKRPIYILLLLAVMMGMTACTDTFETIFGGGIDSGDEVMFTTMVPDAGPNSRSARDEWEKEIRSYKAVNREYTFDIEMWKQGADSAAAKSQYQPASDLDEEGTLIYPADGTLKNSNNAPLYWQDNVSKWGFKATAGTKTLGADQTDQEKWLAQDRLLGYSYLPIWYDSKYADNSDYRGEDDINAINYRTNKEWYADNKQATQLSGIMADPTSEDYKKVPLFLQHQRSWVTVILKAGEGVTREALAFATSSDNIKATIYSYEEGKPKKEINAWPSEYLINYDNDKNGDAATDVSTTRYDAIIEPHNFIASRQTEENDIIARVSVSNQNFTFAAANDFNYSKYIADGGSQAAKDSMQVYNLEPGKHLTITATLSRASRMIMITAWIEDWTETVTQTICDDYGQNGDPILINYRSQLIDFLTDPEKNKPGNMAMIVPNALPLDSAGISWDGREYELKATLNLANASLSTSHQLLNKIDRTGSIINGEIAVSDAFTDKTAIANENKGTIERVRVTTSSETSPARASVAGLVDTNYGTIYQCSSALTVEGSSGYVGGIAAKNLYEDANMLPVIDGCTVTARVGGSEGVTAGGGIVGLAAGRVSNNTFDYGITISQTGGKFQNIIAAIGDRGLTVHSNNSWPTMPEYIVPGSEVVIVNANTGTRYDAVIDSRDELKMLLQSGNNQAGKTYRVANSFSVDKENWIWGADDKLNVDYFSDNVTEGYCHGAVKFTLNGNGKTITLTGSSVATMLFGLVLGNVYDLNLSLDKPIVADRITSDKNDDSNTDAIAAFCYGVTKTGVISNITLKAKKDGTTYIESTTPAGIAVRAMNGGEIRNCASDVPVKMHVTAEGTDARHYAGGIVAVAEKATITQCKYYADHGLGWTEGDDASKAKQSNCRYGGILGGTSEIANSPDTPSLIFSENHSWWILPEFGEDVINRPVMGGVIGSTVYHDGNDVKNAMTDGNVGNYWVGTAGAGLMASGVTEEKAIGRKNSVTPSKPMGW